MTKRILFLSLIMVQTVFADPHLELVKDHEFSGGCRRIDSERGLDIGQGSEQRLQSSYMMKKNRLILKIKSFNHPLCMSPLTVTTYEFECTADKKDDYAICTSVDEKKIIKFAFKKVEKGEIKMTSISDNRTDTDFLMK